MCAAEVTGRHRGRVGGVGESTDEEGVSAAGVLRSEYVRSMCARLSRIAAVMGAHANELTSIKLTFDIVVFMLGSRSRCATTDPGHAKQRRGKGEPRVRNMFTLVADVARTYAMQAAGNGGGGQGRIGSGRVSVCLSLQAFKHTYVWGPMCEDCDGGVRASCALICSSTFSFTERIGACRWCGACRQCLLEAAVGCMAVVGRPRIVGASWTSCDSRAVARRPTLCSC